MKQLLLLEPTTAPVRPTVQRACVSQRDNYRAMIEGWRHATQSKQCIQYQRSPGEFGNAGLLLDRR